LSATGQMLKREKEEGAKRVPHEDGFATTLPNLPFSLGTELQSAFQTSKNTVNVCCPYFDNSTFDCLGTVRSNARIIVVCTYDEQLKTKISAGKLSAAHVRKTFGKKKGASKNLIEMLGVRARRRSVIVIVQRRSRRSRRQVPCG
jgi:hypothetical protein